jgi:sulfopyruvate decarboxylase TPP-binding subunit
MGIREEGCAAVIDGLEEIGLNYFIHVPDSYGSPVIQHFRHHPTVQCFSVAREEEGIGIAAGLAMGGKKGVLFYQDVGLGNSMVALTTFAMAYHMPMLILAIRRGGFGEFNAAVHNYSETAIEMVESMKIKASALDYRVPFDQWPGVIKSAYDYAHMTRRPIVVFLNLKD